MLISNRFLYKDLVHHPLETSIYKWLALGFQVDNAADYASASLDFWEAKNFPRFPLAKFV